MTKPHLLYIAFWFPPSRASGVYRALATAKAFHSRGWDVTVLTTSEAFLLEEVGSVDASLVSEIPAEIDVVRVDAGLRMTQAPSSRTRQWVKRAFPGLWSAARVGRNRVRAWLSKRSNPSEFDERYAGWIQPAVSVALDLDSSRGFDHILATGNPYSAFEVAFRVAEDTGTPFSVDFRDPWTIDVFSGDRAVLPKNNFTTEARIVDGAAACIHVNQQIALAYGKAYPSAASRQFVVENGFDARSVDLDVPEYVGGPMRVGMLGTVNDRWPLDSIFKAWDRARSAFPDGSELVLGGYLGYFSKSSELIESSFPDESSGFRYIGPVRKDSVASFYRSLDVVLVPVPGGSLVTSGKIYEALALGIPVVCVQEREGAARLLTDGSPVGLGAGPEAADIARALVEAVGRRKDLTKSQIDSVRSQMAGYERDLVMRRLVDIVEDTANA